jgi:hypothetical protein
LTLSLPFASVINFLVTIKNSFKIPSAPMHSNKKLSFNFIVGFKEIQLEKYYQLLWLLGPLDCFKGENDTI